MSKQTPSKRCALLVKEVVDVCGAAGGLILLGPLMLVVAAAIRISMGSPVLFRQKRPGFRGEAFEILKFRTMREPKPGEVWFRSDADRMTRLGYYLRKTSIDELPELWNVLKREMSLVGPRPLLMEYLDRYTTDQLRRHDVRPGITGLAQIMGRQHLRFSDRLKQDIHYVDNWSLWLDVKILFITVFRVFGTEGVLPGQDVDEVDDLGLSTDRPRPAPTNASGPKAGKSRGD